MKVCAVAILATASLLLGPACMTQRCDGLWPGDSAPVLLTEKDAGAVVPVARYQPIGVLLPGSNRRINDSDEARLLPYHPTVCQPPDMTFASFAPVWAIYKDKLSRIGGRFEISAPAQGAHHAWHVTVIVGTDPGAVGYAGTYFGRGVVFMSPGQSFVVSWTVGGRTPIINNPAVLAPAGLAMTMATSWGARFTQQLFVATGYGTDEINAPDALPLGCNISPHGECSRVPVGPSQKVVVADEYGYACSLDGGCEQTKADASGAPGDVNLPPLSEVARPYIAY